MTLIPEKAKANDVKSNLIVLHFLVNTGSHFTYMVRCLADGPFHDDIYGTIPIIINGVELHAYISPPDQGFNDVNLVGVDYFEAIKVEFVSFQHFLVIPCYCFEMILYY